MSKRRILYSTLLVAICLAISGVAFPWGSTGGDGSRYAQVRETGVFYNNSGSTISDGMIVVIDTSGTAASTLGSYITTSSTDGASGIVGVALGDCAAATACVVVTKGPADTLVIDSGSNVIATGAVVGVSNTTGYGWSSQGAADGVKAKLGRALEAGDGTSTGKVYVWVDPE